MMDGIGKEFIEGTKYKHLGPSDQMQGRTPPPLESPCEVSETIVLPKARNIQFRDMSLRDAVERRRSVRRYTKEPVSLEGLAFLLWCTQGVQSQDPPYSTLRTVPSAGARHALETYLLIHRVEGLEPGLYRYLAMAHRLALLDSSEKISPSIVAGCLGQGIVATSAVTFLWTAVPYRMAWRYGERAYRYLHLDAGHACQNLYLSAEAVGCGVCAIAAFDDDAMNRCLGLDGTEQFVIYCAALGKK